MPAQIIKLNDTLHDLGAGVLFGRLARLQKEQLAAAAAAAAAAKASDSDDDEPPPPLPQVAGLTGGASVACPPLLGCSPCSPPLLLSPGVDLTYALQTWMSLQQQVNGFLDATKLQGSASKDPPNGIRQLLEKKEGLFRMNMMGKRVNFAARSVISPDPFLNTDQVGVPLRFAKVLTYRQPVTSWNLEQLRGFVVNGADTWPGATHVEDENGTITDLSKMSLRKRQGIANRLGAPSVTDTFSGTRSDPSAVAAAAAAGDRSAMGVGIKRVWRHLQDDDIMLLNRQPTLHKPSITAMR